MSTVVKEEVSEISPVLFLDTEGQSMRFYLRPGPTKMQLYPLVTNGGGTLCRTQEPGAILLADPRDVPSAVANTGQTYISTHYISDCVKQNQQLDLSEYRLKVGPSVQTRMASRSQSSGRMGYSPEDDAAILNFIAKRNHEAKGNRVWKEMEKQRITDHSWQSMKDRFLKHLKHKLSEKSSEKCPGSASKRKALTFIGNDAQMPSHANTSKKSPKKTVVMSDSDETQLATENSLHPTVITNPQLSPERASSPPAVAEVAGEQPDASEDDGPQESCVQIQEQETMIEEIQVQTQPVQESPEVSKRPRLDKDCDGQDIPHESDGHSSSLSETSTPASKKLGILARAAKEFEDSDVMDDDSEEEEGRSEAPFSKPSETLESSAAPATFTRTPDSHAEHHKETQQGTPEALCNGRTQMPEDEGPGPSSTSVTVTSKAHMFIFDSETQEEDNGLSAQEETLSRDLSETHQHVMNLMRETKKNLVEVIKALLKASGDVTKAQVYLLEGYEPDMHGPHWTRLDDEMLLIADPYELEQLQSKYGEDEVSKRRAFLRAGLP